MAGDKKYTDDDLRAAEEAVLTGYSQRKAAKERGIPLRSLQRYLVTEDHEDKRSTKTKITPDQEQHVVDWILMQEKLGYAPTHGMVKTVVERMAARSGNNKGLGKHWMERFLKRRPEVHTKLGKRVDWQRVNGASVENINKFFDLYETVQWIPCEHRYNTDEAGIMEGIGINGLVVRSSESKRAYVKSPQNRNWTSFIETISADGRVLDPTVIFKGLSLQEQWFRKDFCAEYPGWTTCVSENGWTSNQIALEWMQKCFLPQTDPSDDHGAIPRLLIVDGHGSHTTDEFMALAFENNVYMLYLPAHASHVLQPLDLAIFSSLKAHYRSALGRLAAQTDSTPLGKLNFIRCYAEARKKACIPSNIASGWRATGLWPVNRQKPLRSDLVMDKPRAETPPPQPAPSHIHTPRTHQGVQKLLGMIPKDDSVVRLATRKLAKSVSEARAEVVMKDQEIAALREQLERCQPKKKRKFKQDPNSRFMTFGEIAEQLSASENAPMVVDAVDDEGEGEEVEPAPARRSGRVLRPTKRALEADDGEEDDR